MGKCFVAHDTLLPALAATTGGNKLWEGRGEDIAEHYEHDYIYVVVNMANCWLSSNSTFECFVGRMQKYIYFSELKIFYLVVSNYLYFYNWLLGL